RTSKIIDPCSFQLLVYDFQPKDPEDPYAAIAVLFGRSVPRQIFTTLYLIVFFIPSHLVGYSKEDAEKVATEFNKTWEISLRVGVNDCRHYTNDNTTYLSR
ncbi:hypothetical protein S83_034646, partial [Arachis hypogaea]